MHGRLTVPALAVCLLAADLGSALAQAPLRQPERVTDIASVSTGQIVGQVLDDAGNPLDGAVVSALGSMSAFAVSDKLGQFSLGQLAPGAYLVRAHRQGYLTVRGTIVEVRPAVPTPSSFTLRREGEPSVSRVTEAGMGTAIGAQPVPPDLVGERSETGLAWRLRRLKRGILRDSDTAVDLPANDDFSFMDPFEYLGRAVETSARVAGALFADISLEGQVDLLTTGAFDSPAELLQTDRTRSIAFFSVGANVGDHGVWAVRAAMNQGDLDSWIVAGDYSSRGGGSHQYRSGMSYSLQRYQGGNTAALAAVADTARNVGSVFAYDEWSVTKDLTVGYGATYTHYDYLIEPSLLSPRVGASYRVGDHWRVRGLASRQLSAPGAQEFLPPTRASWLPPQRTFSPLSREEGFRTQELEHYEGGVERLLGGATVGVRAFRQQIDDQLITVFGRGPEGAGAALGHYYVGSAGDVDVQGLAASYTQSLTGNLRGSVEYSISRAQWTAGPPPGDERLLQRMIPAAVPNGDRIHDLRTSVEAEVPQTATRVVVFYRINNAFITDADPEEIRGLDGRFEMQVNQSLPFMNFMGSHWEMLVALRNMFHESVSGASTYDEILVVRPPKRILGGLTVRF
jgi:outer membrane receptor protein involved in Fe transport